jgi:hypothetical protein
LIELALAEPAQPNPKETIVSWEILIPLILEIIRDCVENRDRASVEARLNKPGVREAWALRKLLRKEEGLRGQELHATVREGMDYLADMDAEEIGALVAEAIAD